MTRQFSCLDCQHYKEPRYTCAINNGGWTLPAQDTYCNKFEEVSK